MKALEEQLSHFKFLKLPYKAGSRISGLVPRVADPEYVSGPWVNTDGLLWKGEASAGSSASANVALASACGLRVWFDDRARRNPEKSSVVGVSPAQIGNISALANTSDYEIRVSEGENPLTGTPAWSSSQVLRHPRKSSVGSRCEGRNLGGGRSPQEGKWMMDWREELILKYAKLFHPLAGRPEAADGYRECHRGWREILEEACAKIEQALGATDEFKVDQIEKKWGLCFSTGQARWSSLMKLRRS